MLSTQSQQILEVALASAPASAEIASILSTAASDQAIAPSTAVVPVAITYTTGTPAYVPDGTLTIANGGTPTVVELLEFCMELQRNVTSLQAVLHAQGLTT